MFKKIIILILKSCLVISLYLLRAIVFVTTHLLSCLEFIAVKSKVFIAVSDPAEGVDPYQPKFSSDDLKVMAKKVDPDSTIKEIEERFGISYRQATKVKNMVSSLKIINGLSA